jgi:SAM-dependent methyltransferase
MASHGLDRTHAVIDAYYSAKVKRFGATPRGVDWTCIATQNLRFVQLLRICDFSRDFSLNDLGCGYGALLDFCSERYPERVIDYAGIDLSPAMVKLSRRKWRNSANARFFVGQVSPRTAEVSVASGLFNVCLSLERADWESFVRATLRELRRSAMKGFSANFMAPLPNGAPPVPQLYRTAPEPWVEFCAGELGGQVQVIEGYGLREFTLLVRL